MEFVENSRRILLKSYSVWFGSYLPLIWLAIPEILFRYAGVEMSPILVWTIAFAIASLQPLSRIIKQWG